ncbi:MAG: site-specific integrase [Euryarchaeota archaeon]|nr:site-specific integrase [Euryarchaeota archaeon]
MPSEQRADKIRWTLLSLDELTDAYWEVIAPTMRDDGLDPETERPTHDWLREHDFRTLVYALREHHDRTFSQFWDHDLGLEEADSGYDWGIEHKPTIDALESFLESRRRRGGLSESSINTLRYRLARYVRTYATANDTEDLVSAIARDSNIPAYETVDDCWATFDRLHEDLDGGQTKRRIHRVVDNWYAHLVRRKRAGVNPAADLNEEFNWQTENGDNPRLSVNHVRSLYAAAEDDCERIMILALCAWGLRSGEVAALHRSQFVLDQPNTAVPHIAFEVRKNGPGQVSLLYGRDVLEDRLATMVDDDDWNGYLFPSPASQTGHRSRQTILNWFNDLAERANLPTEIDGEKPVPQMGRRFWYDAYSSALDIVLEGIDEIAAEQGSSSPEVVLQNYLSDERLRTLRRDHMRERLAAAFEG